jgi:hypothetical protein
MYEYAGAQNTAKNKKSSNAAGFLNFNWLKKISCLTSWTKEFGLELKLIQLRTSCRCF